MSEQLSLEALYDDLSEQDVSEYHHADVTPAVSENALQAVSDDVSSELPTTPAQLDESDYSLEDQTLYSAVRAALRKVVPEVKLLSDKHASEIYTIAKVGSKTVCYVTGSRKVRVVSPDRQSSVLIVNPLQIPVAVEFVQQFVKEEAK